LANFEAFRGNARWRAHWLPVFADGGGDFLAVQCDAADSTAFGSVVHYRLGESDHPVEYQSVGTLLATICRAYEIGAIHRDQQGWLEQDDEAFAKIAGEYNPAVSWWDG
jgi:cell wall assembly regulator SMI1